MDKLERQVTLISDVSVAFLCHLLDYSTYYEEIWLLGKYISNVLCHVNSTVIYIVQILTMSAQGLKLNLMVFIKIG